MKFWTRSLIARLVTSFLLVATIAVALLGYTAYRLGTESIQQSVIERLSVASSLKEGELNRWVDDQRQEVQVLAASPIIRLNAAEVVRNDPNSPIYRSSYQILTTYLPSIVLNKSSLTEIFILSNDGGKIVYSTDKNREGLFRLADRYFIQGQRAALVQNVYPSPITLKPTITIAAPLFDATGKPFGVLAGHINLDRLDQIVFERVGQGETSESYLVDRFNDFVSGQRFGRSDFLRGVHTVGIDAAIRGEDGSALYTNYDGVPVVGVYRWIEKREFALITEISQDEAFAPARRLGLIVFGVGFVLELTIALVIYLLTRQIVRPVSALTRTAAQVAAGDLTVQSTVFTNDEIGVLARTFNRMTTQLRQGREHLEEQVVERTAELRDTNARLQQLATELSEKNQYLQQGLTLAHDIQLGLLPDRPPWHGERLIAAGRSLPSAEVGGDFYTFVDIRDSEHVAVAIGDISGKGVGAALMMALTSSTLEERAREGTQPGALLSELNTRLAPRLKANKMNAALLYAMFDLKKAIMYISNAGMIAPLLIRNGAVSYIDAYGLPLGSLDQISYTQLAVQLQPGDSIVLMSDGVVEAHNEQGVMFGFDQIEALFMNQPIHNSLDVSLDYTLAQVAEFIGASEQHDDVTLVLLHFNGAEQQ